ncbi:MAG: RagB/SusD family nutrient uptake outer membrane protein, partial [Bacteroidales bacterium]|nr:RagB/SusD family nutrient uptake outer membrane protein [Bacteroidales bacterium]
DASTKEGEVIVRSHINNASELDWYFSYMKSYISSRPACAGIVALYGEEKDKDVRYGVCFNSKRMNAKNPERRVRMSEILLMLAEGYYHKGEAEKALSLINELRANRIAGVLPLTLSELPEPRTADRVKVDCEGKAITALLQTILDERRKELFMEGDRWFELKRNGRPEWWIINNGLKYTVKEYLYTPPIYKSDVDMDPNMKQNPGYGTK